MATTAASPDIFALLAAHRDPNSFEQGSKDGYARYHAHLTRRLSSVRKALGVSGKGKIDVDALRDDQRAVELLLLSAERAYISSLAPVTSAFAHSSKSAKQQTLSRLQKALGYTASLVALPSVAADPVSLAQAHVFRLLLTANRALKREDVEAALEAYVLGLLLLRALAPKLGAVEAARANELAERDFAPALRFCAYKLRASSGGRVREVDEILQDFAPLLADMQESLDVPGAVFDNVSALPDADEAAKAGGTLTFLGQERPIASARLVRALAKVEGGLRVLRDKYAVGIPVAEGAAGKRKKGVLKAFDRVLSATADGLSVVATSSPADDANDGQSSASLVGDYLAYVQATTLIQRDLHLLHHLLPRSLPLDPASPVPAAQEKPDAKTLVKVVRLLGAVVAQWETVGALGAVERGARGEGEAVEVKVGWFRALRLYYLTLLHLTLPVPQASPEKALTLLPALTLLLRQLSASLPSADEAWPLGGADPEQVTQDKIERVEQLAGGLEKEAKDKLYAASRAAEGAGEGEKTFLDLAVNFVDLDLRPDPALSASAPAAAVNLASAAASTAHDAANKVKATVSAVLEEVEGKQGAAAEEEESSSDEEQPQPQKKGWLGGWFGRG